MYVGGLDLWFCVCCGRCVVCLCFCFRLRSMYFSRFLGGLLVFSLMTQVLC